MKRTWQPKKNKLVKAHGFLGRMAARNGRVPLVIGRRRKKGRSVLAPSARRK